MPVVPFLPVIASAIGAGATIYGANKAAGAVNNGVADTNAMLREFFGKAEGYLSPSIGRGNVSGDALMSLLGLAGPGRSAEAYNDWLGSTDYKSTFNSGVDALDTSAANRGGLYSGKTGMDLTRFGQDHMRGYQRDYQNRLFDISGLGVQAGSALAGMGQDTANSIGQNMMSGARANAGAWGTGTSAFNSMLEGIIKGWPKSGAQGGANPASVMNDWRIGG